MLDALAITSVLRSNPAGVSLSSTQIYAILGAAPSPAPASASSAAGAGTDANAAAAAAQESSDDSSLIRYRPFARKAAQMILMLFDPSALKERSSMIRRSIITPIQLLAGKARGRIERAMRAKLREFDADRDGCLSKEEFKQTMADTGLLLSGAEVDLLRTRADSNGDGLVDLEEFVTFAYETLLHLQRDAALKQHMKHAAAMAANGAAAATVAGNNANAQNKQKQPQTQQGGSAAEW